MERKEEAIVTIEVAGDPAGLPSLADPRMRSVFAHQRYSAHAEPWTPSSRKERRRDPGPAKGAAGAP